MDPDFAGNELHRFMTAIRFPTLDVTTGRIAWGISYVGCQRHYQNRQLEDSQVGDDELPDFYRMYTNVGFLKHMEDCKWARKMWRKISRPIYNEVRKEHMDPETLDEYELPWDWNKVTIILDWAQ